MAAKKNPGGFGAVTGKQPILLKNVPPVAQPPFDSSFGTTGEPAPWDAAKRRGSLRTGGDLGGKAA